MEDFLCFAETYLVCDFQKIALRWTVNIVVFWRGRRFLEEVTFTICVCGLRGLDSCNLLKFSLYTYSQSSSAYYILVSLIVP